MRAGWVGGDPHSHLAALVDGVEALAGQSVEHGSEHADAPGLEEGGVEIVRVHRVADSAFAHEQDGGAEARCRAAGIRALGADPAGHRAAMGSA